MTVCLLFHSDCLRAPHLSVHHVSTCPDCLSSTNKCSSVCLSVCLSVSACLPACLLYLSIYLSIYLSVSVCLSVCLRIYCIYLSVCLPVCLFLPLLHAYRPVYMHIPNSNPPKVRSSPISEIKALPDIHIAPLANKALPGLNLTHWSSPLPHPDLTLGRSLSFPLLLDRFPCRSRHLSRFLVVSLLRYSYCHLLP